MAYQWFADLFGRGPNSETLQGQRSSLLNLPETTQLSLNQCQDIYTYWGLGKRIVHALPRFAFSAPREINIQDAPPEAVEEFNNVSANLKQDRIIRRTSIFCRIWGMSGLFVAYRPNDLSDGDKYTSTADRLAEKNLTIKETQNGRISFNALNPLNLSGSVFSQDATATNFQKPERIVVKGIEVGTRRATIIQNSEPVYLRFSTAAFTFSGIPVYQNMVSLIKAWTRAIISLERMATKASAIVFKDGERGKVNGIMADAASASLMRIKEMENDGACSISKDGDAIFFPLTGVSEVDVILKSLNMSIMMALDDTPAAILLDKDIANGLSEGSEQLKAIIMAVDTFREEVLTPLYSLTDPYVMACAWTDEFIQKMIKKYPAMYSGYTVPEVRQIWQDSFSYEYGNLYPEPDKDVQATNGVVLDNLMKVRQLGGDLADIQAEITERKLFNNVIDLKEDNLEGLEDDEEEGGEGDDGKESGPDKKE